MYQDQQSTVCTLKGSQPQFKEEPHSYSEFETRKLSGEYRKYDIVTNTLLVQGRFSFGEPSGTWTYHTQDKDDEMIISYVSECVGAMCNDGTTSSATGRGACSWHGGVSHWLYRNRKVVKKVAGIFQPLEQRYNNLRNKALQEFNIPKNMNQKEQDWALFRATLRMVDSLSQLRQSAKEQVVLNDELENELSEKEHELQQAYKRIKQLEQENKKLGCKVSDKEQDKKTYKRQKKQQKNEKDKEKEDQKSQQDEQSEDQEQSQQEDQTQDIKVQSGNIPRKK